MRFGGSRAAPSGVDDGRGSVRLNPFDVLVFVVVVGLDVVVVWV